MTRLARPSSHILVLIVDDHPVVVSGCRAVLATDPSIEVISAADEKSGFEAFQAKKPDIAIVDINLPDLSGFELLRRIKRQDAGAAVIMLSMNEDPAFVLRAIELGANGYLSKTDDPRLILDAVRQVAAGETYIPPHLAKAVTFSRASIRAHPGSKLSARELETLRLLARGKKIVEVAGALDVSYKTVANTTSLLKRKLKARSHSDLIRMAVEMGIT